MMGEGLGVREADRLLAQVKQDIVLRLSLGVPSLHKPLLARVISTERAAVRGGLGVCVGCAFLPMGDAEQDALAHYLAGSERASA